MILRAVHEAVVTGLGLAQRHIDPRHQLAVPDVEPPA